MFQTLEWTGQSLRLLDQTRLPTETVYVEITDAEQMWDAIKRLVVRGAPAIGVSAAFGVYLGVRNTSPEQFSKKLSDTCDYLATSRPTAVNLFWAIERVRRAGMTGGKQAVLDECLKMVEEDIQACLAIGENGLKLLQSLPRPLPLATRPFNILTHCNAGALVAVKYGTALAPVYVGVEQGVAFHVYSDETRPLLQGSRLTAYEMTQLGVPVTVLCDSMAATLMSQGKLDAVIVGADRIAANGDTANKIGTMGVAILAKHFGVPFYIAAPMSTVDFSIESGKQIPIEHRDAREVVHGFGKQTAPVGADVFNPAFDVTPAELIAGIITEKGVAKPPIRESLGRMR